RFVFPGYRRTVQLRNTRDPEKSANEGIAVITDNYGLSGFDPKMDAAARFKRYRITGRVRDMTTLSGNVGQDPWALALLDADITNDPRRIAGTHYDWDTKRLAPISSPANQSFCPDWEYPYDATASQTDALFHSIPDQCMEHGFEFQASSFSWRGTPGTADAVTSTNTVQTSSTIDAIDDFGRVTSSRSDGDLLDGNDDLCANAVYAQPTNNSGPRVLSAVAQRTVTDCASTAK